MFGVHVLELIIWARDLIRPHLKLNMCLILCGLSIEEIIPDRLIFRFGDDSKNGFRVKGLGA